MGGAALVAPRRPWGTKVWHLKELVGVPELQMVRAGIGAGRPRACEHGVPTPEESSVRTRCAHIVRSPGKWGIPPSKGVYERGVPT